MGITDHDTVKAVIDWKNNNYQSDQDNDYVTVIPGIELSAYSEQQPQIHITGYFPKTANFNEIELQLENHVKEIRYFLCFKDGVWWIRIQRCKTILNRLQEDGIIIPYSDIEKKTVNRYPSLPIIAECLYVFSSR